MQDIKQFSIGGVTYNVSPAPAVQQKKLLLLVGAKIALTSATSKGAQSIDEEMLTGSLLTFNEETFDRISDIVLWKTFKQGETENKVTVDDFQMNMLNYVRLIAKAIKLNLDDFFGFLDGINSEKGQSPRKRKKAS